MAPKKQARRHLDDRQLRTLQDWCISNAETIKTTGVSPSLTDAASKFLSFPATERQIRRACKAVDIPLTRKGGRRPSLTDEAILSALCASIRTLLKAK